MSKKDPQSGPVGNTDPSRRGRNLPRQDRDPGPGDGKPAGGGRRGGKPGYGDVTKGGERGK